MAAIPVEEIPHEIPADVKRVIEELEDEAAEGDEDMDQGLLEDIWLKAGEMDVHEMTPDWALEKRHKEAIREARKRTRPADPDFDEEEELRPSRRRKRHHKHSGKEHRHKCKRHREREEQQRLNRTLAETVMSFHPSPELTDAAAAKYGLTPAAAARLQQACQQANFRTLIKYRPSKPAQPPLPLPLPPSPPPPTNTVPVLGPGLVPVPVQVPAPAPPPGFSSSAQAKRERDNELLQRLTERVYNKPSPNMIYNRSVQNNPSKNYLGEFMKFMNKTKSVSITSIPAPLPDSKASVDGSTCGQSMSSTSQRNVDSSTITPVQPASRNLTVKLEPYIRRELAATPDHHDAGYYAAILANSRQPPGNVRVKREYEMPILSPQSKQRTPVKEILLAPYSAIEMEKMRAAATCKPRLTALAVEIAPSDREDSAPTPPPKLTSFDGRLKNEPTQLAGKAKPRPRQRERVRKPGSDGPKDTIGAVIRAVSMLPKPEREEGEIVDARARRMEANSRVMMAVPVADRPNGVKATFSRVSIPGMVSATWPNVINRAAVNGALHSAVRPVVVKVESPNFDRPVSVKADLPNVDRPVLVKAEMSNVDRPVLVNTALPDKEVSVMDNSALVNNEGPALVNTALLNVDGSVATNAGLPSFDDPIMTRELLPTLGKVVALKGSGRKGIRKKSGDSVVRGAPTGHRPGVNGFASGADFLSGKFELGHGFMLKPQAKRGCKTVKTEAASSPETRPEENGLSPAEASVGSVVSSVAEGANAETPGAGCDTAPKVLLTMVHAHSVPRSVPVTTIPNNILVIKTTAQGKSVLASTRIVRLVAGMTEPRPGPETGEQALIKTLDLQPVIKTEGLVINTATPQPVIKTEYLQPVIKVEKPDSNMESSVRMAGSVPIGAAVPKTKPPRVRKPRKPRPRVARVRKPNKTNGNGLKADGTDSKAVDTDTKPNGTGSKTSRANSKTGSRRSSIVELQDVFNSVVRKSALDQDEESLTLYGANNTFDHISTSEIVRSLTELDPISVVLGGKSDSPKINSLASPKAAAASPKITSAIASTTTPAADQTLSKPGASATKRSPCRARTRTSPKNSGTANTKSETLPTSSTLANGCTITAIPAKPNANSAETKVQQSSEHDHANVKSATCGASSLHETPSVVIKPVLACASEGGRSATNLNGATNSNSATSLVRLKVGDVKVVGNSAIATKEDSCLVGRTADVAKMARLFPLLTVTAATASTERLASNVRRQTAPQFPGRLPALLQGVHPGINVEKNYNGFWSKSDPYCCVCSFTNKHKILDKQSLSVAWAASISAVKPDTSNVLVSADCFPSTSQYQGECGANAAMAGVLLTCVRCNATVHAACYGVTMLPAVRAAWKCDKCRAAKFSAACCLCHLRGGALKRTTSGGWVHLLCALLVPGVTFKNRVSKEPVNTATFSAACKNLECLYCHRSSGACIRCHEPSCVARFHVTCCLAACGDLVPAGVPATVVVRAFTLRCHAHSTAASVEAKPAE